MSPTIRFTVLTLGLAACGGSEAPRPIVDASVSEDAAAFEDDDDGFQGCPTNIPTFALGMQASGQSGHVTATLVDASNVPPLRYLNDWTVAFSANGAPLADAVLKIARPFMPVHGHDGIVVPIIEPLATPGQVHVRGLNFNMRGPWEVQLTVSSASVGDDYIVFDLCVQE